MNEGSSNGWGGGGGEGGKNTNEIVLSRKKVWRHLKNELTNCQNMYKIMLLIILEFDVTSFLTN